jgi:uncharacterized protein involved in exopolysaccharide biosynthesis
MANQYRRFDINTLKKILSEINTQIAARKINRTIANAQINMATNINDTYVPSLTLKKLKEFQDLRKLQNRRNSINALIKKRTSNTTHYGGRKRTTRRKRSIRKKC